MKLTTNISSRNNWQKPTASSSLSKVNSKKILNMILFSVSNIVERFDELLDRDG